MTPISSSLINLPGAAPTPAARSSMANAPAAPFMGLGQAPDPGLAMPAAASAMLSQVLSALRASFTITPTATPASAALTPAENADQNFSSALAQAVQSGDGSASSADAVRNTVLQALGDVSQFLLGAGTAPVDVNAAGSALQSRLDALMSGLAPGAGVAGQATLVQKEKATLQIRTAEGDIVTLRIRARSSTTASFAAGAAADGTTVGAANMTTVDGARVSVDVQGNISAAEAAAIGDVVRQMETLADQFFAGNVAQAFASAGSLQIDSTQLAAVALRMRYSASFSAVGVATGAPTAPAPASVPAATPADGSSTPTVTAAGTDAAAAAAPPPAADPAAAPASAPAADPAAATTPTDPTTAPTAPPSIMSILQDFLKQVLDLALSGTGDQSIMASAHLRLKLLLTVTQTLAPAAPSTPASAAAPAPSAGSGGSTDGTAAAPAAGTTADPAAAVAKLGSVVGSIGSQLP
jgi:hypothetical protein